VEVLAGATFIRSSADCKSGRLSREASRVVDGPEAPENSGEGDKGTEGGVDNHVGLPLVTHVTGRSDLDEAKDVPAEEVNISVGEVHRETRLDVALDKVQLLFHSNKVLVLTLHL